MKQNVYRSSRSQSRTTSDSDNNITYLTTLGNFGSLSYFFTFDILWAGVNPILRHELGDCTTGGARAEGTRLLPLLVGQYV